MKDYTPEQRAEFYNDYYNKVKKWPPVTAHDKWVLGVWNIGNNYKGSGYYGAYPPGYLDRMGIMFPDAESILHLFSGSLPNSDKYTTVDLDPDNKLNPDYRVDAEKELHETFGDNAFDLIYADPPYSAADAVNYGTKMINRRKVLIQCAKILQVGGYLVWMDERLPMFSKKKDGFEFVGNFGITRSTNHRTRSVFWFKKVRKHEYPDPYSM